MSRYSPLVIVFLCLAACAATPYLDGSKPHRTAQGFRNVYPHPEKGGFWQWKWDQWRTGLPIKPDGGYRFETARPDLAFLRVTGAKLRSPGSDTPRSCSRQPGSPRFFAGLGTKAWFEGLGITDVVEMDW